jgi:hypothetical protein
MDDKKNFDFDPKEVRQFVLAGEMSMKNFATLLRSDIKRIEENIKTLEVMLSAVKKHDPENTKEQAQLKTLLDAYKAWLAKYDGLVVQYEHADDI